MLSLRVAALLALLSAATAALAQTPSTLSMSVPRVIGIGGEFRAADGSPPSSVETVTFRIYSDERGGAPLWQETQTVSIEQAGFYNLMLGATERNGIPLHVFASGEARWVGVTWSRPGEVEGPRTPLTSVPYALRAADAETLGGLPAAAYQLAPVPGRNAAQVGLAPAAVAGPRQNTAAVAAVESAPLGASAAAQAASPKAVNPGAAGYLAQYVNAADVAISPLYHINGYFGFNTTTPQDIIHSRFTNNDGTLTGLAVQNLGNTAGSYSGMLFYDQVGAVAQFQGFSNFSHEYRVNNVASNGSMNFMLASTTLLRLDPAGKVLVGTTTPETAVYAQGAMEIRAVDGTNRAGIFARKPSTNSGSAIEARAGAAIGGNVIKALSGVADNTGVFAEASIMGYNVNSAGIGVLGYGTSPTGIGVYGFGGQYAGQFLGNVNVSGTLTKGGGAFQIDHPLDPENKYLMHSFVESDEMMNIYNGNVVLDARGEATVMLPQWFESLNRDFRYQLTSIGAPSVLYIAEEIVGGRFRIAGGMSGGKVSWQVTGVRQDAWANANRIPVEKRKSQDEVGRYLHPKARGLPETRGLASHGMAETRAGSVSPQAR